MDTEKLLKILKKSYPQASCSLNYSNPFQLLAATILSAQCTDERVNKVTPALFREFPTPQAMAKAPLEKIKKMIRSTGFYNNKAISLKESSRLIVEKFNGRVPDSMEGLLSLRGVARKTANVVLSNAFEKNEGVVVDTHVKRLSFRLGLTEETDPEKIEQDLMKIIPVKLWGWFSHALVYHGRAFCSARNPLCSECPVKSLCPRKGV
ncbi:MAG: endonuclease III [Elusimicrobiota bacterium]